MSSFPETAPIFALPRKPAAAPLQGLNHFACSLLERLSGLHACERRYRQQLCDTPHEEFPRAALEALQIGIDVQADDLQRVPRSGAAILVANHPFGAVEGLVLMSLLESIRPDVRFMANDLLARVPQLRPRLIGVDPFGRASSARRNVLPLREALAWVRGGGLLVVFPAGEVASWQRPQRVVTDPAWSQSIGRIVRRSGAPVIPVHFPGRNPLGFQLAGLLSPLLRTALLPRQLLNKSGRDIALSIGQPLAPRRLAQFADDRQLIDYLRTRCYLLGNRYPAHPAGRAASAVAQTPLAQAISADDLERELGELPEECQLLESGPHSVYVARASQITLLLLEIGRLRELTFRQVGEGTGLSRDIDSFDGHYRHLFIWHREHRRIVGAYRLGASDEIHARFGRSGFYSSTLFNYRDELLQRLDPGLEMGRSFIQPDYQKSFSSLLLLWKGIGAFVARNPRYRYLFGPVSISRDYADASRQLIVAGLRRHYLVKDLARLVKPRIPVRCKPLSVKGSPAGRALVEQGMDEIDTLVADLESDGKGIPVLLRQYLNLGGRLLAFNLDPAFANVIDGLLLVDLLRTDEKQLVRYLGREGTESFRAFHSGTAEPGSERCACHSFVSYGRQTLG